MLIGYARVSQIEQKLSLQFDALLAAQCEKIFSDQISGAKAQRPGLTEALDYCRAGDVLVVWRLDRLGRSLPDLLTIVSMLEKRGVGLRSLAEAIDTTTVGGKLAFHLFGSLAEFERALIRERTRAGLAAARQRGRVGGRPRALTPEKLEAASRLLADGTPPRDVAAVVGVSIATLYRHLPSGRKAA